MVFHNATSVLRKFLTIDQGSFRSPATFTSMSNKVQVIVQFFYLFLCFNTYQMSTKIIDIGNRIPSSPLWPVEFLGQGFFEGNGLILLISLFFVTLMASVFPLSFLLRLFSFLGVFLVSAFQNSFGAIAHGLHFLMFVSFAFLFLPTNGSVRKTTKRETSMRYISVFWFVQIILLFSYSLAGIWKLEATGWAVFSSETMMNTVVNRALQNGGSPIVMEKLVASNMLSSQIFFVFNLCIQLFSVFVFFRPSLHKLYGTALCLFHLGTYLILQITFPQHVIIWGLFFILSPFSPARLNFIYILQSIPFIQFLFNRNDEQSTISLHGEGAKLVYDGECPYCSKYAELVRLKEAVGGVQLINAREGGDIVDIINKRNIDLDEGMVFILNERFYYGAEALNVISLLSNSSTWASKINKVLFRNKFVAFVAYPILKMGRAITLKIIGVKKINR
jgi:predicted DCC family thiol-disulfide oxidoreductase YuxK